MGCNTKNSTHAGLVSGEISLGFRDRPSCEKGSAWLVGYYWTADVKVSVTCLLKRKELEGRGKRGLLCNQLHQWLIIIIVMREISWHTEGLSKPSTLYIYLSFTPPSSHSFCCSFCSSYGFFSDSHSCAAPSLFSPFPLPVLSLPFPAFHRLLSLHPAFLCSDMYNCRVEERGFKWMKGNNYLTDQGTWQRAILLKPLRDVYVGDSATAWLILIIQHK